MWTGKALAMSTVKLNGVKTNGQARSGPVTQAASNRPLHRIGTVRRQEGVSLRTVARQLGTDMRWLKLQQEETTDLHLSDVYDWQKVLAVPVVDLLVDPGTPLSRPVLERAQMVRLMKTAAAICEQSKSTATRRMARMMVDQLVSIMPELSEVGPWHTVGQRRGRDEYGRAVDRCVSEDLLYRPWVHRRERVDLPAEAAERAVR